MAALGVVALLVAGCGGPFGIRVGFNPETIAAMKDDPAASCIIVDSTPIGGVRVVWWRDPRLPKTATASSARECLDPRSLGPSP